jgi:hypothetical protein
LSTEAIPPEYLERLGMRLYFDTNFDTDDSPAAGELRRLHREGWVNLCRADTVDTELLDQQDPERRAGLLRKTADYVESRGPMVLGHSRLGACVLGSDADEHDLDLVYRTLWPESDRFDDSTNESRRKLRDAMHVATARRYGASGFITRDGRILAKSGALDDELDGLSVITPEDALAFARRMRHRRAARQPPAP